MLLNDGMTNDRTTNDRMTNDKMTNVTERPTTEWLMDRTTNIFSAGFETKNSYILVYTYTLHIQDAHNLVQDARNISQDTRNLAQDAHNLTQDARPSAGCTHYRICCYT